MVSLQATVKAVLDADATLTAALTGGIFDAAELEREGLPLPDVRDANGRVIPHAVIRWRASNPTGPESIPAEARFCEVWLYQDTGYATIEAAKHRVKTLLHRQYLAVTTYESLVWLEWAGDLGELADEQKQGASTDRVRFRVTLVRK